MDTRDGESYVGPHHDKMSCHGKDVKLDCRGSNRSESFYVVLRLTAGCFLDCHKSVWKPRAQDWIHMWMDTSAPIF